VEDRDAAGIYLEMAQCGSDDYASRASILMSRADVSFAWWGQNANPDRTDLPRTMEEFRTLALYEVDSGFIPPETPDRTNGLCFERTKRPGQGLLTGCPTLGVLLVLISPKSPDDAKVLRDWADFVHIRHIAAAAVPGYTMITPFENKLGTPRFMHLYEMTSDDPESTFGSMRPLVEQRLGPQGSVDFDHWAWHPQLRIDYVNTFARRGFI
jgi:hypothetical protein